MQNIEQILNGLDLSKLNCFYADVRLEDEATTLLGFKNGTPDEFAPTASQGAFLRVYNNGKWFYKSTTDLGSIMSGFDELIVQSQKFSGECRDIFAAVPKTHEDLLRVGANDPRNISLAEKRALAESYFEVTKGVSQVTDWRIFYRDRFQKRAFKSSRGRSFLYDFADYGMVIIFNLRDGENLFRDYFRSWSPTFAGLKGRNEEAKAFLQESLKHIQAPAIIPGKYPVVMNSEVVGVFTHESFGHKSEADFMIGDETAIKEWAIGSKVAADCVSIVDDSTLGTSGYCPIDDEGIPKTKTYLIKEGRLAGRLHSLSTAHEFDEAPTGNARAMNFEFEPIVRMTNTYIEAGKKTEADLIASVKHGVLLLGVTHGSGLSTFTIAPSRSYWIRDGKIAEPVKVPVISGTVFETLGKISAVANHGIIANSAFGGCGKDEQWPLRVADGGPMILVDEMQVG